MAPPLIKTNATGNSTAIGNCNLFPGDSSCVHNPTYNITSNNTTAHPAVSNSSKNVTVVAPPMPVVNQSKNVTKAPTNNTNASEPSVKITAINGHSLNNTGSSPQTNNTNTITTTSTSTNTTSVPKTNTTATMPAKTPMINTTKPATNTTTQAHQCPDGSFADANASCVA